MQTSDDSTKERVLTTLQSNIRHVYGQVNVADFVNKNNNGIGFLIDEDDNQPFCIENIFNVLYALKNAKHISTMRGRENGETISGQCCKQIDKENNKFLCNGFLGPKNENGKTTPRDVYILGFGFDANNIDQELLNLRDHLNPDEGNFYITNMKDSYKIRKLLETISTESKKQKAIKNDENKTSLILLPKGGGIYEGVKQNTRGDYTLYKYGITVSSKSIYKALKFDFPFGQGDYYQE